MKTQSFLLFLFLISASTHASAFLCSDVHGNRPMPSHSIVDDANKPQNRSWVLRQNGRVAFDTSSILQEVQRALPSQNPSDLSFALVINGIEQPQRYPWGTKEITIEETAHGQIDYYLVVKKTETDASGGKKEKIILISDLNLRESFDSQNVEAASFSRLVRKDRLLKPAISKSLKRRGIETRLTEKAIEIGYKKVVWVLKPEADRELVEFIHQAQSGVTIKAEMDQNGVPQTVLITDRATGRTVVAAAKNFYFKVDAAFNGNSFFWDDMFVALTTIPHHPALARSTIEFWLDVQKMNQGVIPREVRKSNLRSLWFDSIVRAGEKPKANLQYTNPYLMHWVAERLVASDPSAENYALMKRVVDSMEQYTRWMEKNRAVFHKGQFIGFMANALGSGLDNSRGSRGNDHSADSYKNGWVDPLAQQISMYKSIARWQKVFRDSKDPQASQKLESLQRKIAELENLLNTKYWNQEHGFYFDLVPDGQGGLKQDTRYFSVAGFWPLFSGSASKSQLNRLIKTQLTADHFGGTFPFPANSLHAIKLDAKEDGYWNLDARWPSMATVAIEGFRTSGRPDVAHEMAVRFLKSVIEANPDTVAEFYGLANKLDSSKGKGRVGEHQGHTTRLDFAGWGKVPPVYLMLEHIIGLSPQLDGKLHWNVMIPMEIGEKLEVANYMYRGKLIQKLTLEKTGDDKYTVHTDSPIPVVVRPITVNQRARE